MPSKEELKLLQALPLELKVEKTKARIREWVNYYGVDGVYVSFSGGKDSTVLLHLVRELYPQVEAVFVNTGLEYPEIQAFVKTFDNVTILRPKMRFDEVIKTYGYPFISKKVGHGLVYYRKNHSWALNAFNGKHCQSGEKSEFCENQYAKWKPVLSLDFIVSDYCCGIMKEKPLNEFKKKKGKMAISALLAEESSRREQAWLKTGCNAFSQGMSKPMSFWTEQDILTYIKQNNLPIASVYGGIVYDNGEGKYDTLLCDNGCKLKCSGCQRTGCIFCGFGAHNKDDDRFVRLKKTHPKQYAYCMGGGAYDTDGVWKPTKDGLGMAHCIDELNKIYGKDFIRY